MKTLLLILATTVLCFALEEKCPQRDISTCKCRTYFDGACILTCSASSQADINRIAEIPNLCEGHVHFALVHSMISGIPAKLWKTLLSSKTVDISIAHSLMDGLIPAGGEDIPEVHTSGPAVIKIEHSILKRWDWKQLSKFYPEDELTLVIEHSLLKEIGSDFSQIAKSQVHTVVIEHTVLAEIQDRLFADFTDLRSLSLQNNQLTYFPRSMLPVPARKLEYLHLNGNRLTTLPGDMFKYMPALEAVYLRDNNIKSLPQEFFQSISSNNLQRIDLVRNPWECDCSLMRILQNTKYRADLGVCATPKSLAGKKVADLPNLIHC